MFRRILKKKGVYAVIVLVFMFFSCDKELKSPDIDFDVNTTQSAFKTGEPVKFNISGNAENITFFSGEAGSVYEYRNRTKAEGTPQFSFTSFRQYGIQENTLNVFASTSFDGKMDENIGSGTWTDITDKVALSTGADNTPSGTVDLTEFDNDNPLYIAFRYLGFDQPNSAQRTWTIKNFVVQNILKDGTQMDVADMSNVGWREISVKNSDRKWAIAVDQIKIGGGPANTPDNEDWAVTKPLNLSKVQPDIGFALKNITTKMTEYEYIYDTPGDYVVTFIATNARVGEEKSVIKELNLKIVP